ncbi:hypothetical protein [Dactylosporangium sp. CA-233914]|uniref:hypothetical protein n=1 Tax=Dactylosporangium sp. CA-233914 TaxID=3239934 RepID=UPI003D8CF0D9
MWVRDRHGAAGSEGAVTVDRDRGIRTFAPELANNVFGFSTISYLQRDVSRDTAIGIAAAAVAQLLQQPRS